MAHIRFGTDGVRGVANSELDPESVVALGRATARVLGARSFLIGRDTRRSGPLLQAAMSTGIASEGADVIDVGVLPTPGVAWLSSARSVPAVVISASHNPFADNGIKVFAAGGLKLSETTERAIQDELDGMLPQVPGSAPSAVGRPEGQAVGSIRREKNPQSSYIDHLVAVLDERDLSGVRVVVDCANGASYAIAPTVLERLGVTVHSIGCDPDGTNINDGCGSTHPEALAMEVVERGADLGIALDGDADRLVAVDHKGHVTTGDELMALFALDLSERHQLNCGTVVVTVMSNLGFRKTMAERGIEIVETPVGDRNVLEAIEARGLNLGGEQSGHIIFRHLATTGDGLLSAVVLMDLLKRKARSLSDLVAATMRRLPQVLVNVRVPDPSAAVSTAGVRDELASVEQWLGEGGRVLLRVSGTEPVVRVMAEATDEQTASEAVRRLCEAVENAASTSAAARRS